MKHKYIHCTTLQYLLYIICFFFGKAIVLKSLFYSECLKSKLNNCLFSKQFEFETLSQIRIQSSLFRHLYVMSEIQTQSLFFSSFQTLTLLGYSEALNTEHPRSELSQNPNFWPFGIWMFGNKTFVIRTECYFKPNQPRLFCFLWS